MTNTYDGAVTLYSDETQVSLNCTFPILEKIRISDAQNDEQNVPVDDASLIRRLAVMLM